MERLRRHHHRQRRRRRDARPAPRAVGQAHPAARARRLAAARAAELERRRTSSSTTATSRRTPGTTTTARPFQPQVHYFVGGATKLYGAALYRLRAEDFGELRHHDGISPAWPISYDELEPYYTQAEQLYQVHGARGEDPTEPPASAPYPFPPSRTSRASSSCPTTWRRPATTRSTRPAACMLDEAQHALQRVRPLRDLRRVPLPRARQVRRRGARRAARARAPQRHAADRTRSVVRLETERRRHAPSPRWWSTATVPQETLRRRHRRASRAARRTRPSCCCARPATSTPTGSPTAPTRSAATTCSTTARPCSRCLKRAEPDGVPEDARAQRLLLRQRRLRVPDGQHPDGRQVAGADVPRREAAARRSSRRSWALDEVAATPSTSGCRPRTCRGRRTA